MRVRVPATTAKGAVPKRPRILRSVGGITAAIALRRSRSPDHRIAPRAVVEPTLSVFTEAAQKRGRLSVQGHLCLLLAKAEGWTCVSNDRALRAACSIEGVDVLWGLEMMGLAMERGLLPPADAERVARGIRDVNPFITEDLVQAFVAKYLRTKAGRERGV